MPESLRLLAGTTFHAILCYVSCTACFSSTKDTCTCRSWAGLKDHAQYWIIMGCLGGAGESWCVCILLATCHKARVPGSGPQMSEFAAGLLALLISGRLTLSNVSPLALTLSNTYGNLYRAAMLSGLAELYLKLLTHNQKYISQALQRHLNVEQCYNLDWLLLFCLCYTHSNVQVWLRVSSCWGMAWWRFPVACGMKQTLRTVYALLAIGDRVFWHGCCILITNGFC